MHQTKFLNLRIVKIAKSLDFTETQIQHEQKLAKLEFLTAASKKVASFLRYNMRT